jgi:broad specificity phosphatase PhoE
MELLLSRHGNTFGPTDPVVWAGATNDLELVEKGIAQAEVFADYLIHKKIKPAAIYCSALRRTSVYAGILAERLKVFSGLNLAPTVDSRLHEIDYGKWTGLTQEEVIQKFGKTELEAWNQRSVWPSQAGWQGSRPEKISESTSKNIPENMKAQESIVRKDIHAFSADLVHRHHETDTVIVVTSQGRLRYFLTLVPGEFEKRIQTGGFKVKTGQFCQMSYLEGAFQLKSWDINPASLLKKE